jgi:hypothetical protein
MKWLDGYRMRLMFTSFIMAIMLGSIGPANGATITVGPGASYDFNSIQAGIDAANDADTVLVAPGEYVITEPLTFRGKAITVMSEAGRDETTIRMGTPADPKRASVVVFENGESTASVLNGFTINGGSGCRGWVPEESEFHWIGGGIFFNASSATVRNCAIVQNQAEDSGGGVSLAWGSSATLTNCIIDRNVATELHGGGVLCYMDSSSTLTDCAITGNSAGETGGGVFAYSGSSVTLTNCIVRGNSATEFHGGGVFCYVGSSLTMTDCTIAENSAGGSTGGVCCWKDSPMTLTNCTIVENSAERNAGLCSGNNSPTIVINCTIWGNSAGTHGGGLSCHDVSATVINSILWGNTSATGIGDEIYLLDDPGGPRTVFSITHSNVAGGQAGVGIEGASTLNWGEGNIEADPCFVDPNNDDFHLKSEAGRRDPNSQTWVQDAVTSPCIDRGDPNSDWTAELWPHGTRTNMGAYGGTPQASMSLSDAGNVADLNADNAVHFADFANFVGHWRAEEILIPQDLDRDGTVGPNDLAILADNWLAVVIPLPLAHWKLDETEGTIAYESIGSNDGTLNGDPNWQPTAGKVNGALKFNGTNNYISTDFVLNPAYGPFSVFAWIKGGAPGQVIISQKDDPGPGSAWLCAESSEGKLRTNLMDAYCPPLESETVITDGQWHHVGLVYDFDVFHRHLYVDGVEVAKSRNWRVRALQYPAKNQAIPRIVR